MHLFVSGRRPSHVPDPQPPLSHLDDAGFVAEINRRYGGIPAELLAHADVMALLLPSLRADIRALEDFGVRRGATIACPITALGGHDDPLAPLEHLQAWRDDTDHAFQVRQFPGDHFYLDACRADVLAEISLAMRSCLGAAAPAGRAG
jgi:medium-chain acyl-[acyl-carrier-protein] hydrolase